ncbi:MAG: PEP-CTERM sorting domain-containing protein [Phycisphaerales bacterium]|nr:PEP-CTERM sorting domain-containing protein [Phycisphaerales bacterium]
MAAFGLAVASLAGVASATPVTILNPSFEAVAAGEPNDGSYSLAPHLNPNSIAGTYNGTFNSWGYVETNGSGFQDFGIENPSSGEYTGAAGSGTPSGADGANVAFLNQSITGGVCNIFQDVGVLQANTTYTLTVAIGQRLDRVNGAVDIGLINASSGQTNPWANGAILSSTTGVSSVAGTFQDFTATFTTGGTVTGDLFIGAQYVGNGTVQGSVDNFRLNAASVTVPEPASLGLLSLAGAGLLRRRRRNA